LFFIIDSLYDSAPNSMTVIDEPELSLHPQFQRRLRVLLSEMSADRQIVYATHSPYFISWADIENGAEIARIHKTADGTKVSQPARETLRRVSRLSHDLNNPHVLGLDASEVFFLEDNVLLVEGQEDVVRLPPVLSQLGVSLNATFFGWGVGGAEKMAAVAGLLQDMGFKTVAGLLDNDKAEQRDQLEAEYPAYRFACIPADDIRPKAERTIRAKTGLTDEGGQLRPELATETRQVLETIDAYFREKPEPTVTL
jgi:predicted ATP-dependent endonuclease of OLD family